MFLTIKVNGHRYIRTNIQGVIYCKQYTKLGELIKENRGKDGNGNASSSFISKTSVNDLLLLNGRDDKDELLNDILYFSDISFDFLHVITSEDAITEGDLHVDLSNKNINNILYLLFKGIGGSGANKLANIIDTIKRIDKYGVMLKEAGGCHVLFGPSGSGKTYLVDKWQEMFNRMSVPYKFILASEPSATSLGTVDGVVMLITNILLGDADVILMDSLRGIVYSGSGSTLSGGVSADLVEFIASISSIAAWMGVDVITVVNPLQTDNQKNEMLIEAIKGSATSIILLSTDNFDDAVLSSRNLMNRGNITVRRIAALDNLLFTDEAKNTHESSRTVAKIGKMNGLPSFNADVLSISDDDNDIKQIYLPLM